MAYTQKLGEILTAEQLFWFSRWVQSLWQSEKHWARQTITGPFRKKKLSKPVLKDETFGGIQTLLINPCFNNKQKWVCRMLENEQNNWIKLETQKEKIFFWARPTF